MNIEERVMEAAASHFAQRVGTMVQAHPTPPSGAVASQVPAEWAQTIAAARCWAKSGDSYFPVTEVVDKLPAGAYRCCMSQQGPFLEKMPIKIDSLLALPDGAVESLLAEFKKFWTLQNNFAERGFTFKRGMLMWGPPGCHERGQKIVMFDGTLKAVEDIEVGDRLMGPDSKPRTVLKLCRGREGMVRVKPVKGRPFVVNEGHVLALAPSGETTLRTPINMTVRDYRKQSETFQNRMKLYRSEAIDFGPTEVLPIPAYIFGVWIGDGHSCSPALTTADKELAEAWSGWGESLGLAVRVQPQPNNKSSVYCITGGRNSGKGNNGAINALRKLGVLGNKHIPHSYLTCSIEERKELLAGLLDTDGFVQNGHAEYVSVLPHLAEQVAYVARSIGLAAYVKKCRKGTKRDGVDVQVDAYRVGISGNISEIPVRLERRMCKRRAQAKDVLRTGFTIEDVGVGDYYGFVVDRDHLYLLDDFTVTHNSGKTSAIWQMTQELVKTHNGIVIFVENPSLASACISVVRRVEPERPMITVMEDLDALVQQNGDHGYLALLDGELQISNVCHVATTNYPEYLDRRFVDRPSRFDTIMEVGMPSSAARRVYFQAKEPSLDDVTLRRWVDRTADYSVAHLREVIIAVKCFGQSEDSVFKRLDEMRGDVLSSDGRGGLKRRAGFTLGMIADAARGAGLGVGFSGQADKAHR